MTFVGAKHGELRVVGCLGIQNRATHWECECSCGKLVKRSTGELNRRDKISDNQSCRMCAQRRNRSLDLGESSWRFHYRSYQLGAIRRSLKFEITLSKFKSIAKMNCHYCGEPPRRFNRYRRGDMKSIGKVSDYTANKAWILANGVDRKDSSIGYISANCVPCCSTCNYIKLDLEESKFLKHVFKVADFRRKVK